MMELNLKNAEALTCLRQAERLYPTLAGIKGWLALAMARPRSFGSAAH